MHAAQPHRGGRGVELLLVHCAPLSDPAEEPRPCPRERLRAAVGEELARMLVNALSPRRERVCRVRV